MWNEKYKTYESTAFGHPAKPKSPETFSVLGNWNEVNLGITFENDGLRVQATITKKQKLSPKKD